MSDHKPITGELRKYAALLHDEGSAALARIKDMCDAIDAIHAGLEREYAATLAEREGDWIKLPVDADGLPIHIGDVMEWPDGSDEAFEVVGIGTNGTVFYMYDESCEWTRGTDKRHYQPDTWERIIEDALGSRWSAPNELSSDFTALVARCKKLAGDAS